MPVPRVTILMGTYIPPPTTTQKREAPEAKSGLVLKKTEVATVLGK